MSPPDRREAGSRDGGDDELGAYRRDVLLARRFGHREPGGFEYAPYGEPHRGIAVDNMNVRHWPDPIPHLTTAQRADPHLKRC